jgi:hypothetical protein
MNISDIILVLISFDKFELEINAQLKDVRGKKITHKFSLVFYSDTRMFKSYLNFERKSLINKV